jgi:hypothetical protein
MKKDATYSISGDSGLNATSRPRFFLVFTFATLRAAFQDPCDSQGKVARPATTSARLTEAMKRFDALRSKFSIDNGLLKLQGDAF